MEAIVIENNLDKECNALGGLFQQIVNEMKAGVPNFEELVNKAGKLHSTLKTTILVLGSFLDTFQKIADAATNTKGATRDVGTCLTRIVIRHRALESRMKTLSGALMDCLVLPVQNKLEEWKKITTVLDKEHAREYKKYRSHIKKKSEQVVRLRKKTRKEGARAVSDPSIQRLVDQCTRDLNGYFRQLHEREKKCVRQVLTEERHRYCTFVASLKPVIDEELGMLGELGQIEEVMQKLSKVTANPDILPESSEQVIDDASFEAGGSLCFATPPSTPSPSMGSRKSSMCSIASVASSSRASSVAPSENGPTSPSRSSITSADMVVRHRSFNQHDMTAYHNGSLRGQPRLSSDSSAFSSQQDARPSSALSASIMVPSEAHVVSTNGWIANEDTHSLQQGQEALGRPHTISTSYERGGVHNRPPLSSHTFVPLNGNDLTNGGRQLPNSEPVSPSKLIPADMQTYSTIKRSYRSPFRRPSGGNTNNNNNVQQEHGIVAKRPPLPNRCSSADRSSGVSLMSLHRSSSVERSSAAGKPPIAPNSNNVQVIAFTNNDNRSSNNNGLKEDNLIGLSPSHYAVPRANVKLQMVPDFHQSKADMVIPQPVYMNAEELDTLRRQKKEPKSPLKRNDSAPAMQNVIGVGKPPMIPPVGNHCESPDEDLKTPTVEELSFPGQKAGGEDGSSSSSSGSSSGYGSQNTIKFDDNHQKPGLTNFDGISHREVYEPNSHYSSNHLNFEQPKARPQQQQQHQRHLYRSTSTQPFSLQSPLQHRAIVENIIYTNNNSNYRQQQQPLFSNILTLNRRAINLRRSDSFSPGMPPPAHINSSPNRATLLRSCSQNATPSGKPPSAPPPPPLRRSSSISSQDARDVVAAAAAAASTAASTFKPADDDDATPHGSVENIKSAVDASNNRDHLSLEAMVTKASNVAQSLIRLDNNNTAQLRRSTSLSTGENDLPPPPPQTSSSSSFFDRDQLVRRSLTLTSRADRANLINTLTERISQRMQQANGGGVAKTTTSTFNPDPQPHYNKVGTHHVIPVSGPPNKQQHAATKMSPEGEIYGFGVKFKETSRQYFTNGSSSSSAAIPSVMSASYPSACGPSDAQEAIQNQMFLDALSTKLMGKSSNISSSTASKVPKSPAVKVNGNGNSSPAPASKSKLNAEIESGAFSLRKTNGIVRDRSAPRL